MSAKRHRPEDSSAEATRPDQDSWAERSAPVRGPIPAAFLGTWRRFMAEYARLIHKPLALIFKRQAPRVEVFRPPPLDGNDSERSTVPPEEVQLASTVTLPICWPDGELFGAVTVLDQQELPDDQDGQVVELLWSIREAVQLDLATLTQRGPISSLDQRRLDRARSPYQEGEPR